MNLLGEHRIISTFSPTSPAAAMGAVSSLQDLVWVTNLALYIPFRLGTSLLVTSLWVANGSSVGGNIDIGIYDLTGKQIVSTGSKAQSGVSAIQSFATTVQLGAGVFYFALALDSGNTVSGVSPTFTRFLPMLGVVEQTSAFPLPASATFAATLRTTYPLVGCGGIAI